MGLIEPDAIPGRTLEPEQVETSAAALSRIGRGVRHSAASVRRAWHGLSECYEAPEAGTLLTAVQPVAAEAATFDTGMQLAGRALTDFAQDLRPIKAELGRIRAEAADFVARVAHGVVVERLVAHDVVQRRVPWDLDPTTVDQNNALLARVARQVQLLAAAEEACALRIYGAVGEARCGSAGAAPRSAWRESLATSAAPWGGPAELRQDCLGGIGYGMVDMAVANVRTLGALEGWDPQSQRLFVDEQASVGALTGLEQLAFGAATLGPLALGLSQMQGPIGDLSRSGMAATVSAARGLVAFDMWSRDPARAAGQVLFNVAAFGLPVRGLGAVDGTAEAVGAARWAAETAPEVSRLRPSELSDPRPPVGAGERLPSALEHRVVLTLADVSLADDPLHQSVRVADLSAIRELTGSEQATRQLTIRATHDPVAAPEQVPVREPASVGAGHDIAGQHHAAHLEDEPRNAGPATAGGQPADATSGGGVGEPHEPVGDHHQTGLEHSLHGVDEHSPLETPEHAHEPPPEGEDPGQSVGHRIFVVTGRGAAYPIPEGWLQRMAENDRGLVFQKPGSTRNADLIRIMEPSDLYPDGYVRVHNAGRQPVDPFGKPGSRTATHVPQTYRGEWPAWPT